MDSLKTTEVTETFKNEKLYKTSIAASKPSNAFIGASWCALIIGMASFCIGLFNANTMLLNEKGYYFTILLFGLFSVVSVQKSVRDRLEGIPVTDLYYSISWFTTFTSVLLLIIGLWNADMELSEKGFYGMSFTLSLFAAIAVQKNTRDLKVFEKENLNA
ncbi:inner membrane protein YiaA [Flavobacterium beibuense]|uniref:YiaAB two helix domain-containing protein n=1 Tax=Flavobacterium beibuense TaxID=657326 RepID=A0A444WDG5_9FLAO|nr:inner membrane protein YiaA [Flavobacterium beibuense]RYJ43867.1 YiaAB two helix domain-containing protein [Flavobacterium beibuense]